jgi:hypothetical protein
MTAYRKKLHVICIHDEWGWSHEQFTKLKDSIEEKYPDFWEFFNLGTILIYYKDTKKGFTKSSSLIKTLQNIKTDNSELNKIGIGDSEGEMVFETNVWGKIVTSPLGGAANEAIEKAKQLASTK